MYFATELQLTEENRKRLFHLSLYFDTKERFAQRMRATCRVRDTSFSPGSTVGVHR